MSTFWASVYKLLVEFEQQLIFKVSRLHPGSLCSEQQWVARRRPKQVGQYWVSGTVFWYSERSSADPYWLRRRLGTLLSPLYLLTFWTSLRKINHLHLMNVVQLAPASNNNLQHPVRSSTFLFQGMGGSQMISLISVHVVYFIADDWSAVLTQYERLNKIMLWP